MFSICHYYIFGDSVRRLVLRSCALPPHMHPTGAWRPQVSILLLTVGPPQSPPSTSQGSTGNVDPWVPTAFPTTCRSHLCPWRQTVAPEEGAWILELNSGSKSLSMVRFPQSPFPGSGQTTLPGFQVSHQQDEGKGYVRTHLGNSSVQSLAIFFF